MTGAPDALIRADCLLAALSAEMVRYWTGDTGHDLHQLSTALQRLACSLCTPARSSD